MKDFLLIHIPKTAGCSIRQSEIMNENFVWHNHKLARDIRNLNNFFSFCFIRNPYEKVFSSFCFYFDRDKAGKYKTFKDFIIDYKKSKYLGDGIGDLSASRHFKFIQYDYVTSKSGKVIVDFIGQFENLEDDFKKLQLINGIKEEKLLVLPHFNERRNRSDPKTWKDYYTPELANIVYNYWKKDFDFFNFDKNSYKK